MGYNEIPTGVAKFFRLIDRKEPFYINPKQFSENLMKNLNKDIKDFQKETESLYHVPYQRRHIPIL